MEDTVSETLTDGIAALEHITGPSRGRVTWFSGASLEISLSSNQLLRVSRSQSEEPHDELIAHLNSVEDTYEITALGDQPVWVNGVPIETKQLAHRDVIEFGEKGPLSRFRLYSDNRANRKLASEILSDGISYLRTSRQPVLNRLYRALSGLPKRLTLETTLLFRVSVILAILALATLAYQQHRLNSLLHQQIQRGANQIETFAGALARARSEALNMNDLKSLRRELDNRLSSNTERLASLERRSKASARVISESMPSVLFLQGSYGFKERSTGRMLRHAVDASGRHLILPMGQPILSLKGEGPIAERQITGTGFAVGVEGVLITNRHVALPWENDTSVEAFSGQGLDPVMIKYIVYEPGKETSSSVELVQVSKDADLAVLRLKDATEPLPGLHLAKAPPAPGDEVIVIGYPTGLRSMLAQSGKEFVEELQNTKDTGFWSVGARLAKKGYIAPLSSRGIVSQTSLETIVYDAETTHGGSGGPVLDVNGAVVAVNTAILPEYGGSNLGIPVAKVLKLLMEAGIR
jgi:serine protease Do